MSFSRSAFTGFPFDDSDFGDRDRDQSFRSHIDDIVNRHPELADHLSFDNSFPFGSNSWGHKRRGSTERDPNTEQRPENRRFGRPLRSRFEERFGFPFASSFDDPYHYQAQEPKPPTQEPSKSQTQEGEPAPKQQETQPLKEEKPPQAPPTKERNRKQNSNIQQSNTVDLGQKQEPVSDSRGQRSMSAPPENRSGQQRFVSSINIPMFGGQNETETHQQAPPQAQASQQPSSQGKGAERVIPIHVEGRDVPVVPRHDNSSFTPPPQQQQAPRNNFGQRPLGHWNRGNSPYYTGDPHFYPEDGQSFGKAPYKSQKPQQQPQQQQQKPQNVQQNQQRGTPSPQPRPSTESQLPTPPPQQQPQPPQKLGPMDQIKCIQKNVLELMSEVERFNGKPKDKQYMYLDEMLTRNLLKLDDVETEGKDNIRQARKEAINCIQRCISILEAKAAANEQLRNQLMQIDKVIDQSPAASLEVSGLSRSGSAVKSNEEESTPMEVDNEKTETPKETNAETETNPHETINENEPKNIAEEAKISEDNTKVIEDNEAVKKKEAASESG